MDICLLKKIAQYVMAQMKAPQHIKGYDDIDVKNAIEDMFEKGVLTHGKATKYHPADGNYKITEGSRVPVSGGETIEVVNLHEHEFEKCYGEKCY